MLLVFKLHSVSFPSAALLSAGLADSICFCSALTDSALLSDGVLGVKGIFGVKGILSATTRLSLLLFTLTIRAFFLLSLNLSSESTESCMRCFSNPPLGVEVVREFQEFQEFQEFPSSKSKSKRRERVAKIRKTKKCLIVMHLFCFELDIGSACSIDLVLQMLNFPHLSIHQEVLLVNS